jgi:hypothetical protein
MNPRTTLRTLAFGLSMLVLVATCAQAESIAKLSDDATISLLTLWPGNEIYIAFGHSALRVRDPKRNIDLIFNYGTFDFTDPLFIPKFVKGYLNYYLIYYPFREDLEYDKRTENRIWYEQILNLDVHQANALFDFLIDNARPENRYYRYDFIMDNCATRIRDALLKALGPAVHFDPKNVQVPHKSYRQMINEFVADRPFYRFMFYPVLGMASDKQVTSFESQFLPLYMMKVFDASTIFKDGKEEPLVRSSEAIYSPSIVTDRGIRWANPEFIIWPCAVLALFFTIRNFVNLRRNGLLPPRHALFRLLDASLFCIVGLMGCLLFYLTAFSVHAAAKENLSVIWLLPTNLVASFFLMQKKPIPEAISFYFVVVAALCVIPMVTWPIWPQRIDPKMIPLMVMIAARAWWFYVASQTTHHASKSKIPRTTGVTGGK